MKRTIIINENQAYKLGILIEATTDDAGDSQFLDGANETPYPGDNAASSVGATFIDDQNGQEQPSGLGDYGTKQTTDKIDRMQVIQNGMTSRNW